MKGPDVPHPGKPDAVDFAYLAAQTLGDLELEGELLALFIAQGRSLMASLPIRDAAGQDETAHLLKGSARAIGAHGVSAAASAFEQAAPAMRLPTETAFQNLWAAVQAAEAAILAHLAGLERRRSLERAGRSDCIS